MKLKVRINPVTGEQKVLTSSGQEVEGVVAISMHSEPGSQLPNRLTISIQGGAYAVEPAK